MRCASVFLLSMLVAGLSCPAVQLMSVETETRATGEISVTLMVDHPEAVARVRVEVPPAYRQETKADFSFDWSTQNRYKMDLAAKIPSARAWTPESPNLYDVSVTLLDADGQACGGVQRRVGCRSLEFRAEEGLYVNGTPVHFKGFVASTNDLSVLRSWRQLHINAVWATETTEEMLAAADEAGLFVVSPPAATNPPASRAHPCFVTWEARDGVHVLRNPTWDEVRGYARRTELSIVTEALPPVMGREVETYAAGLVDYWGVIEKSPRCLGLFLAPPPAGVNAEWEGVAALRDLWSPVRASLASGTLTFSNHSLFTPLDAFVYQVEALAWPKGVERVLQKSRKSCPTARPGGLGHVSLSDLPETMQAIRVALYSPLGEEISRVAFAPRGDEPIIFAEKQCAPPEGFDEAVFLGGACTNRVQDAMRRWGLAPEFSYREPSVFRVAWSKGPAGSYRCDYQYATEGYMSSLGIVFPKVGKVASARWLGEGPETAWANRSGGTFGLWQRPATPGYHPQADWCEYTTDKGCFKVIVLVGPRTFSADAVGLFQQIPAAGSPELAFNFRGPGSSARHYGVKEVTRGSFLVVVNP